MSIEDDPNRIIIQQTDVTVHQDGSCHASGFIGAPEGISREEKREILAEFGGIEPESVRIGEEELRKTTAGRISVGFSKWRSSWDPHAEREKGADPSLN